MIEWANVEGTGSLELERVLIEYGTPELLVCRCGGEPYLVLLLSEAYDYLIVRLSVNELLKLLLNRITLNEVLFLRDSGVRYYYPEGRAESVCPRELPDELWYEDGACLETNDTQYVDEIMKECLA